MVKSSRNWVRPLLAESLIVIKWDNLASIYFVAVSFISFMSKDDYAKDGGPEVVWHLCGFYQDPLRS